MDYLDVLKASTGANAPDATFSSRELEIILEETYKDPCLFMRFFLPELFPTPMPWFHRGILAILTRKPQWLAKYGELAKILHNFVTEVPEGSSAEPEPLFRVFLDGEPWLPETAYEDPPGHREIRVELNTSRFTLIMVPRGFSKTTLAGIGFPIYETVFEEQPLIPYVSEAAPHAKMQLENVKRELSENLIIRAVFGDLRPRSSEPEKWASDFFETRTGVAMVAKGRGSQIRGLNHRGRRPKLFILDDLEDEESVNTDEQRVKVRKWAYSSLLPAKDDISDSSTFVALGTLLHRESLLMTWASDPEWTVVRFSARDKQGDWLWPLLMKEEDYERKKVSYANAGLLHVFYMEYDNEWRSPETALIREDMIKVEIPPEDIIATAIYLDPAIGDTLTSDFSAISCVSMTSKGRIRIRDYWQKRGAHPRDQIDRFFAMAMIHRPQRHGVETVAFQRALVHLMQEEMARYGYFFEVVKVHNTQQKDERIRGILGPRFAAGYVFFDRKMPELETPLLDYPAGKVDGPDSLAGAIALLDDFSGSAAGKEFDDEYPPLETILGEDLGRWAH